MSIFGKKTRLYNPCPPITREEMWKRAGATRMPDNQKRNDFAKELKYDAHREVVWLEPDTFSEPLDPAIAKALYEDGREEGIVIFEDGDDMHQKRIEGLERAADFYNRMGDGSILPFEVSLTEQQLRLMSRDLQGFRINQAREKVIREYIDKKQNEKKQQERRAQVA